MTRINTNTGSLVAQNRLNRTNTDLQTSLTRLSTGLRINSGKDDPAGLIASESLRSDITSLNKAISNTKRASQIIATADSALGQVSSLLNNVRGLVVEAANKGALSEGEIAANQLQIDSSLEAINRIARTTTFQGRNLLDGSLDFLTQAGTNFSSIRDLKINNANLGPTGQLGVSVSIDAAAQQAEVAVANVTAPVAGVAANGGITLTNTVAAAGATRPLNFTRTSGGSTAITGNISAGTHGTFTLETKNNTDAFNGKSVNVSTTAAGNYSSITIDDTTGNINVVLEEGKTLTAIALELAAHTDFDFTTVTDVSTIAAFAPATGAGTFNSAGALPSVQNAAINVTADVGGPSSFTIVFNELATPAIPTASLSGTTITVSVGGGGDTDLEAIAEAIDGLAGFSAELDDTDGLGDYDADGTTDAAAQGTLTPPVTASAPSATINLVSKVTGAAVNGKTITFNELGSSPTPAVTVTNGNIVVSVNSTGTTSIADIINAINTEGTYAATAASGNTLTSYDSSAASYSSATANFNNGVTAVTGGISQDAVFELLGKSGSEVFNVKAGTTINELITQVNLVSDATGVSALVDPGNSTRLLLRSTAYGSDAFVDLRVISEATGGTFRTAVGAGARDAGTDIVAKVNGVDANGNGNSLSINTAALSLSLTVDAGTSATINFNINGGGALFQLGSDVVSNQQARVGISSVSTARLGGASGRLFQLGQGETAALDTDPNLAANIIEEAITQVTSLRGRLGAFQATTLESNLASLNETVANLTEAESSIRDADFAQESARLTRAQILVQSGTTVLGIANQSPQNVLGLLRQ